jgi:hypothetical protein
MAKDLVRTRRYISKFYAMRTQLQAVSLRLQTMRSNQQMGEAMKGATRVCHCAYISVDEFILLIVGFFPQAMNLMSRSMNIPAMQRILMEFEKQSSAMDMKEEMMSEAVDDVMDVRIPSLLPPLFLFSRTRTNHTVRNPRARKRPKKKSRTRFSSKSWTKSAFPSGNR